MPIAVNRLILLVPGGMRERKQRTYPKEVQMQ